MDDVEWTRTRYGWRADHGSVSLYVWRDGRGVHYVANRGGDVIRGGDVHSMACGMLRAEKAAGLHRKGIQNAT